MFSSKKKTIDYQKTVTVTYKHKINFHNRLNLATVCLNIQILLCLITPIFVSQ